MMVFMPTVATTWLLYYLPDDERLKCQLTLELRKMLCRTALLTDVSIVFKTNLGHKIQQLFSVSVANVRIDCDVFYVYNYRTAHNTFYVIELHIISGVR